MATTTVKTFSDGVLKVLDGDSPAAESTFQMGAGGLTMTIRKNIVVKMDRGVIDHAVDTEEVPIEWGLAAEHRGFLGGAEVRPYEALLGLGGAAGWVNTETLGNVVGRIIELTITDSNDGSTETITINRAITNEVPFQEGAEEDTLNFSGIGLTALPNIVAA